MLGTKGVHRKRMNFMLNVDLIEALEAFVPAGRRSDFLNETLDEKLIQLSREKAFQETDRLQKHFKLKASTSKIIKDTDHGLA